MINLKTKYLGLELKNPLLASASSLSKRTSRVKQMEEAGISAVVMYSLFEEQLVHDSLAFDYFMERGTEQFAEALDYFPELDRYNVSPGEVGEAALLENEFAAYMGTKYCLACASCGSAM